MSEPAAAALPAEVVARLAEHAAGIAARQPADVRPVEAAAVATSLAAALAVLFHARGNPVAAERPVYVLTLTGRFMPHHHGPSGNPPHGSVMTIIFDARTLSVLRDKYSDEDDRALLAQLGPLTILPIP